MRIFISHSAKSGAARAALNAVRTGLEAKGHEVFVDQRLVPGDEWRSRLYHELALCDGAVVLLAGDTLEQSHWVRRELDILLWRHAFRPDLRILTVTLDGADPAAVRAAGFSELTETQFLDARPWRLLGDEPELDEFATAVTALFAEAPAGLPTRMEDWFSKIEMLLTRIGYPGQMWKAAAALRVPADRLGQVLLPGGFRFLAHQFLGNAPDDTRLEAVLPLVDYAGGETLRRLIEQIAPVWVDETAARPLARPGPRDGGYVVLLNAKDPRIAEEYCDRATCVDPERLALQADVTVGENGVQELVTACERTIKKLLEGDPGDDWTEFVEGWPERGPERSDGTRKPRFLVVDATAPNKHVVAEAVGVIRRRFPWLAVIVLIGLNPPTPEEMTRWLALDAKLLEPALEPGAEAKAKAVNRQLWRLARLQGSERWT